MASMVGPGVESAASARRGQAEGERWSVPTVRRPSGRQLQARLSKRGRRLDAALAGLYDAGTKGKRCGGLTGSAPRGGGAFRTPAENAALAE
jgi:hypothetical protein